jgi:hypothetical protein
MKQLNQLFHRHFNRACFVMMVGLSLLILTEIAAYSYSKPHMALSVRVSPQDSNNIEVMMDPRNIPNGYIIMDIHFEVKFYTAERAYLGNKVFSFTRKSEEIADLTHVYRRYVSNPYKAASVALGGNIDYSLHPAGTAFLSSPPEWYRESAVEWQQTEKSYPHVVQNADGTLHPESGYIWVDPNAKGDFRVKLRPGLTETSKGTLRPEKGYIWVSPDDPKDFRVKLRPGLIKTDGGKFHPANGYRWVNPSDNADLRVEPVQ